MDDYISIQAAYDVLTDYYHQRTKIQHIALQEALNRVPKADVRPVRHGHWVNVRISVTGESDAECDQCGAIVHDNFSNVINYCPNCGARMDGE